MKKLGFILGTTCAAVVAISGISAASLAKRPERDARIIVEVNRNVKSLNEDQLRESQDIVYDNIKQYATDNVRILHRYSVLNNAFVMEVNSNDIEKIKSVPGVASVSIDKLHVQQVYNDDEYTSFGVDDGNSSATLGENDNISAATMNKPEDTNDGEGTIVAILDNEFHLQGRSGSTQAWNHEVFTDLDSDVAVKYSFDEVGQIINGKNGKMNCLKRQGRNPQPGVQGSLYYNSKVPFYFDYGGESTSYGKASETGDYDVHSDFGYHGSHVSSITAANAPQYKGIAPKAQLALMKVSTDFNTKKGIAKKLGFSNALYMYDSNILKALEDCIRLEVDGINMSLGSDLDDFDADSISMRTLNRLSAAGILSAISAGNAGKSSFSSSGAYGKWTLDMVETGILGSYANNKASTIIASGHPLQIFYENAFQIDGNNVAFEDQIVNREGFDDDYPYEVRIRDLIDPDNPTKPLGWAYVPGFGTTADYANVSVRGKIAVVNRGSTSFADKYAIAANKGAVGLVIINNDPTAADFNFRCSFGDGFVPTIPCALVLHKDKALFEEKVSGELQIINKKVNDNPYKNTISNFSSDGASFDLDLKPDITTPGDNIKGAVPEHAMTNLTKEEKESEEYKYKCYQYLSGTSMAAPNYAGAQSLVLSKKAGPIYAAAKAAGRAVTSAELQEIADFRQTVDMRLMSTANPMMDYEGTPNPETNEQTLTSPRLQGAGMANLKGALNTEVYLEGFHYDYKDETTGETIVTSRKSKVSLRNNPDIAKGDVKVSFTAHNESNEAKEYNVKLSVMRPALAHPNDIMTKDYNFKGEIEKIDSFSGKVFYDPDLNEMTVAKGTANYKDVFKVSRDFDYYASEADFLSNKKTTIKKGYYYNAATEGIDWQDLPSYTAQSTQDVLLAEVTGQKVTIQPGDSTVEINKYSLTEEQKDTILANFEYGCMIEGFVSLDSVDNNDPDLSIPYIGFYSGSDRDENASYSSAPVAEPFNFEKDITKVYPSDLVNDVTKSFTGRDNGNFESMIVTGYAESPDKIDTDKVLTNDQSFDKIPGFYKVGTNPSDNQYTDTPSNDIYLGSPNKTNTMIIQQFMLRSVADNYFTITKKGANEPLYRNVLQDMLFGSSMGRWSLYKSHVDASYLSAGYVAHRAYAIVPLYDSITGEPFESGEYELKFNYLLAGTGETIEKTYTLHVDSDAPVFKTATQYRDENGVERVRFYFEEERLSYGVVGFNRVEVKHEESTGRYYIDETRDFVRRAAEVLSEGSEMRLFVGATDYARNTTGVIIHSEDYFFDTLNDGFTSVQGTGITTDLDFEYSNGTLTFLDMYGLPTNVSGKVLYNGFPANVSFDNTSNINNNGSFMSNNLVIIIPAILLVAGATLIAISLLSKKRKGGK